MINELFAATPPKNKKKITFSMIIFSSFLFLYFLFYKPFVPYAESVSVRPIALRFFEWKQVADRYFLNLLSLDIFSVFLAIVLSQ